MVISIARVPSLAVVSLLAAAGMTLTFAGAAHAQAMITLEQAVKDCRLIPNKTARLGCYDRAIDAAAAPPRQSMVPTPPAPVALATPPAPQEQPAPKVALTTAAPPAPAPPAVAAAAPPAPQPPGQAAARLDGVEVQIASASINGNNVLSVVTSDGETWLQTDSTEFARSPQAGETMVITKNVFGKRTCHIEKLAAFSCRVQK